MDQPAHISPALKELLIADLVPYARNSRTHSAEQIDQIAASIAEFGFTNPVLVDGAGTIIAGHGRVQAAAKLGWTHVPTISLDHLSEDQVRAYVIADNKLALNAGWDDAILKAELEGLKLEGFDIDLLGFDSSELDALFKVAPKGELDAIPAVQDKILSQTGDVWTLGKHRVMCGDATNADDVATLMRGEAAVLMVTDPPYGVDYDPNWRQRDGLNQGGAMGLVINDHIADWRKALALFKGHVAYVWCASLRIPEASDALQAIGFEIRSQIIWAKNTFAIGRGNYHWQHEPCFYAVRKGKKARWNGSRTQTTVWSIDKPRSSETGHSTQKPVECMRRPMENNSVAGELVYDPFLGSGTTVIAAEDCGRRCFGMEIAPQYVDLVCRRWKMYTGNEAVRESDGKLFSELS